MYLFFDTETSGFIPKDEKDLTKGRMIQLGWILTDNKGSELNVGDFLIKPEGFTEIEEGALKVHNIPFEKCVKAGQPVDWVLRKFLACCHQADFIIAHNCSFDDKVISREISIASLLNSQPWFNTPKFCTMKTTTEVCKIKKRGGKGYKWPTLQELHTHLFGHGFKGAHDAITDVRAMAKCFFKLKEMYA